MWLFHKHIWTEINRDFADVQRWHFSGEFYPYNGPVTLITERCESCKKHRQYELKGRIKE